MATTRTSSPAPQNHCRLVILQQSRKFLGGRPGVIVHEHDERSSPNAVVIWKQRRAEDQMTPFLTCEAPGPSGSDKPGRKACVSNTRAGGIRLTERLSFMQFQLGFSGPMKQPCPVSTGSR